MVYKRYIKRKVNGEWKTFGPYYYESYRDKSGKTHSRYLPDYNAKRTVTKNVHGKIVGKKRTLLFTLIIAIVAIILAVGVLNYQFNSPQSVDSEQNPSVIKSAIGFLTGFVTDEGSDSGASSVEVPIDSGDSEGSEVAEVSDSSASETSPPESLSDAETSDVSDSSESVDNGEDSTVEASVSEDNSSEEEETISENNSEETVPEEEVILEESANETIEEVVNESSSEEIVENETEVVENITTEVESNESIVENETVEENITIEENVTSEGENSSSGEISVVLDSNVSVENETVSEEIPVNSSGNVSYSETIVQYGAVLGRPVRWEKKVKINSGSGPLKIDLVDLAGNVSVKKKNKDDEKKIEAYVENERNEKDLVRGKSEERGFGRIFLNFFLGIFRSMTGRIVDSGENGNVSVEIMEPVNDNDEIVVEYYTDAPYSVEKNISNGKEVKIVGPEEVHYENVLAFTELSEDLQITTPRKISIYWEEENKYLSPSEVYDLDQNGIYDYVEWVVPHLSNQTFRIIVISAAEHLDSNRSFISDIYDEVNELDGNWSETIEDGDYVRVTFERNLTSANDITVYPRIVSGEPYIEVYEVNGTEIVAKFENLEDNYRNKVLLTDLTGNQDTFDLLVLNGSLEFDLIIDPTGACSGGSCYFDDSYIYDDLRLDENSMLQGDSRSFIKWDVTDLCDESLSSVDSAILQLYIVAKTSTPDNDVNVCYTSNETWDENGPCVSFPPDCSYYSNIALSDCGYTTLSSTTSGTYTNITVTNVLNKSCAGGHTNFTVSLEDPDKVVSSIAGISNSELGIGNFGAFSGLNYKFAQSEYATASRRPKLYVTYTVASNDAPQWHDNSTNTTAAGVLTKYSINWTDDSGLSGYIFSYDNGTGSYANDSWVGFSGTQNWSNVTKVSNYTQTTTIKWRVWANDSSGDWNATDEFSYVLGVPTQDNPLIYSYPNVSYLKNIFCQNQSTSDPDGDEVQNVFNWLVDGDNYLLLNLQFEKNVTTLGGNVTDYSGLGNDLLILNNSQLSWNFDSGSGGYYSVVNKAGNMSVSNNSLIIPGDFTVSAWIKDVQASGETAFSKGNATAGLYFLGLGAGGWNFLIEGEELLIVPVSLTTWQMVTLACTSGNCSAYINGTYVNSTSTFPSNQYMFNFSIGADSNHHFTGSIDNVRIFNRSLSKAQIAQLYSEGRGGITNFSIVSDETSSGENWTCQVTPVDSYQDGIMKINYTEIVQGGSTQGIPSLLPHPNTTTLEDLVCQNKSTSDFDGLEVTNVYNWLVDGDSAILINMPFDNDFPNSGVDVITDYSGNDNHGSTDAAEHPIWNSSGLIGGSISFNGSQSFNISNDPSTSNLSAFSIDFWFRDHNASEGGYILSNVDGVNLLGKMMIVQDNSGYLKLYIENINYVVHAGKRNSGNWTHIAFVVDGGNNLFGYNNSVLASSDAFAATNLLYDLDNDYVFGRDYDGADYINASIDNFRMWNFALSSEQISYLYNESKDGYSNISTISSSVTGGNENWTCQVIPFDENGNGTMEYNYTYIYNRLPTHSEPLISPSPNASISEDISCSNVSTEDLDGQNVGNAFNWLVDGSPFMELYYTFDVDQTDQGDIVKDYSGRYNNGTVNSLGILYQTKGLFGGAYRFGGIDKDMINVSSENFTIDENFTINFWSKSVSGTAGFFGKGNQTKGFGFYYSTSGGGNTYLYLEGEILKASLPSDVSNNWQMFTMNCKIGNCSIYVNGTYENSTSTMPSSHSDYNLTVGFFQGQGTLSGLMDDFRVYNHSLSDGQIAQLYLEGTNSYFNSTIDSSETNVGENWTCQVIPIDPYGEGEMKINYTYTIYPSPTQGTPLLSPNPAYSVSDLTCYNQSTNDPEGEDVENVYNWELNGSSVLLLNMPFNINNSAITSDLIYDYSGFTNNGTLGGGTFGNSPTWIGDGINGGAYNFSKDDFITIENDASINETYNFTVELWVRPESISGYQYLFGNSNGGTNNDGEFSIYLEDNDLVVDIEGNVGKTTDKIVANNWYHLAFSIVNGSIIKTYVNGVYLNYNDLSYYPGPYLDIQSEFWIGSVVGGGNYTNGTIDNLRIWNRSLTDVQIKQIYLRELNGYSSYTLKYSELSPGDNWTCSITPMNDNYVGETKTNYTEIYGCVQVGALTTLTANSYGCYIFNQSNGTLDCDNYEIHLDEPDHYVINSTGVDNVTIMNCMLRDNQYGIYFKNTNYSLIQNVTIFNTTDWSVGDVYATAVYLDDGSNHVVLDDVNISVVNATSTSTTSCYSVSAKGIHFGTFENATIKNSVIENIFSSGQGLYDTESGCDPNVRQDKSWALYLSQLSDAKNVTFFNVSVNDSKYGLYCWDCDYLNFSYSSMTNMRDYGIKLYSAPHPSFVGNRFEHISGYVLSLLSFSTNSEIVRNSFSYLDSTAVDLESFYSNISQNNVSNFDSSSGDYVFNLGIVLGGIYFQDNTLYNVTISGSNDMAVYAVSEINAKRNNFTNVTGAYKFAVGGSEAVVNDFMSNVGKCVEFSDNSNISFFNVTFNHSTASVSGSGKFYAYYPLDVNIIDQNNDGILSATVDLRNNTLGSVEQSKETDSAGMTDTFTVETLYVNATGFYNWTPHNITAYKTGYSTNSTNFSLLSYKKEQLTLFTPIILSKVPDSDFVSIAENSNQTFVITYSNTTPVKIEWFINDGEVTASENSSTYKWIGNYSQEGAYDIKVNISNAIGEDDHNWTLQVNDTPSSLIINTTFPTGGEMNISQNQFANMTFNVSCHGPDCGTVNVSLYYVNRTVTQYNLLIEDDFSSENSSLWGTQTEDAGTDVTWSGGKVKIFGQWGQAHSGGSLFMNSAYALSNDTTYLIEWQGNYSRETGYGTKSGRNGMWLLNSTKDWSTTGGDTYRDPYYSSPARGVAFAQNVWQDVTTNGDLDYDGYMIVADDDNSGWAYYDKSYDQNDSDIIPYATWVNYTAIINMTSGNVTFWAVNASNGAFISNISGQLDSGHLGEISPNFIVDFHVGFYPDSVNYWEYMEIDNFKIYDMEHSGLEEEAVLVSTIADTKPLYTNASFNPNTTISMNSSDFLTQNFWVNATGTPGDWYEFFATANLTSDSLIGNVTDRYNVTITSPSLFISILLSPWLQDQVNWTLSSLPAINESALGNAGEQYWVNVSASGGTVDLYMKADNNLTTSGGDKLLLGNETFVNVTNGPSWPVGNDGRRKMTDSYQIVGSDLGDGDQVFLRYFLSAPAGSAAGIYNNTLDFKAVEHGTSP